MKSIKLAWCDIVRTFKTPKVWIVVLLGAFFFWYEYSPLREMAVQFRLGIAPYTYPIFMLFRHTTIYGLMLIVLLMGDAPYYNGAEMFINIRVSKYQWFFGKLIYMFVLSAIFQVIMIIVSVLSCAPHIGIDTGWGDIIRTYMTSLQGMISTGGIIDNDGILSMSPIICMIYEFVLMILIGVIIGCAIFLLNNIFKGIIGTMLVGTFVLFDLYCTNLAEHYIKNIKNVLPTAWVNLNVFFVEENLSFMKCAMYMLLIIAVFVAVCLVLVKKDVIRPVRDV